MVSENEDLSLKRRIEDVEFASGDLAVAMALEVALSLKFGKSTQAGCGVVPILY